MKIIYNNILPVKGFVAINLFGVVFARKEHNPLSDRTINHEKIHTAQMREMLFIFFYIWYTIEWIVRFIKTGHSNLAYLTISFEKEAHQHMHEKEYLNRRKLFSWIKYF